MVCCSKPIWFSFYQFWYVVSSHVFDPYTVWSIPLIWSNPPGCEQRAQWSIQLLLAVKYWTYIHNSADLHTAHIQHNTPHLYWVTPPSVLTDLLEMLLRTHPIIYMPAFINFTAEGPREWDLFNENYLNKRYFILYTPSTFPLLSYILSVSRERISKGQCVATVGTAVIDSDAMATAFYHAFPFP